MSNKVIYSQMLSPLRLFILILTMLVVGSSAYEAEAQRRKKSNYNKLNRNFHKQKYAQRAMSSDAQCNRLKRKKLRQKNRKVTVLASKKTKQRPLAEVDYNDTPPPAKTTPKPAPKPAPIAQKKPEPKPDPAPVAKASTNERDIDTMNDEEKHLVEDIVLLENDLPAPTSEKHEEIRKEVEKHLKNFDKEKPIKLDPLYFVTGQDEFAFVDMDPFLVAVEYALQGKHILIEGHTDHVGDFDANVALSIKRVERIRDLMIQMGVHDDHISVVGYGEEHSETSNSSEKKQEERRVDFSVF